ncbi:MAG: RecX family transcriptional regulator [Bacteroidetes bacterium]|nr:RecX family transcriptional regulator [Bacteroidota bacterium]
MRSSDKGAHKSGMITALMSQKNKDRTSVFVDGHFALGICTDLVESHQLHVGKTLSHAELECLVNDERKRNVRSTALRYLSYSSRTEFQIHERLRKKGFSTSEITPVIEELIDLGYIDDRSYAIEYAQARFKHKGYGPNRIRSELVADGVRQEFIFEALGISVTSENIQEEAIKIINKFQNRVQGTFQERKKKLIGYLVRRGYSSRLAQQLVQEVLSQSESGQ